MNWSNFKIILLFLFLHNQTVSIAQQRSKEKENQYSATTYEKYLDRKKKLWNGLMPAYSKIHFFGGMGTFSIGLGWNYGKRNQWETDLFIGLIPRFNDKKAKATFTIKQNLYPWKMKLNQLFTFEPLSCSIYFNTIFGDQFWTIDPDKYPKGYYQVPTRIRTHLAIGQRINYYFREKKRLFWKSISFYYEITSCDYYIISAVQNRYLKPSDYLNLAFGIKLELF